MDEKSAAKLHYTKTVSGKAVVQSIAFRVVSSGIELSSGINILAGVAPFP